ncbi:MAG: DcaP family trimeric outer membrane transporter [Bacteroidales bacterium]|nr:DcaP family trimeric outer membrane transporter [Bacteroidales bacterium]
MKKTIAIALALAVSAGAFAQKEASKPLDNLKSNVKVYGFVRNYYAFDTRECVAGTEDFFNYIPKDNNWSVGEDLNAIPSLRYSALTSRIGFDISGYEIGGMKVGGKIETDFYCGVSGVTGTAQQRLRQAFLTLAKGDWNLKAGQAWHPLASDLADVVSLNTGSPFGPFSRTPQVLFEYSVAKPLSFSIGAIWQQQYCSAGPDGASANYIKYSCVPEMYLAANYKQGGLLVRVGADMLSIKPRNYGTNDAGKKIKVSDRLTTLSPYIYLQYKGSNYALKAKSIFAESGEHMNLNGGYGISEKHADGCYSYTPTRNSSSWLTFIYGKKLQGSIFLGYVRNFGTKDPLYEDLTGGYSSSLYFSKNSFANMNRMWRTSPTVIYNFGPKLLMALELEITGVQYGEFHVVDGKQYVPASNGLCTDRLHWVNNYRVQGMMKFSF